MALVDLYSGTNFPYVSVTFAVGSKEHGTRRPADNMPTDKMLVFYLLWYIQNGDLTGKYEVIEGFPNGLDYTQNNDYIAYLIGEYQKKNRPTLYFDARADRARGAYKTSITRTVYTILHLYHSFEMLLQQTNVIKKMGGMEAVDYILDDEFTPAELRNDLFRSMNITPWSK
ncbi:MAG TPA: hypothetical protein PKE69_17605 [Pyrinomonadaceae bacterium]|nr:hypothetical protein [Pyrinomonadaceae bacterium]